MNIPFLSLKSINQRYSTDLQAELNNFLENGHYMLGKNVQTFEQNFAKFCDTGYCVGVANGLDALELILQSLNLKPNSEIIVPANTYFASILSILNTGFKPILVEPNIYNYLLEADEAEKAITEKTSAILAVNLYGKMCDFTELSQISGEHNLKLIVDAAQSHGAKFGGSKDCFKADAIAYSFYPTKNLGALADAGAVVTNDEKLEREIRKRRNYGSEIKYIFDVPGKNSRLSELQAGFLNVKLKYLEQETETRRIIASKYLGKINNPKIILPPNDSVTDDAWHLFVVRTKEREALKQHLKAKGIGFDIHYPIPPHKQKALKNFNHLSLPITEQIHNTVLSIPLNSSLTDLEIDYISEALNDF